MIGMDLNLGLLFCRYIYVRYAHGLVSHGKVLFHKIIVLVVLTFLCQQVIMFPMREYLFVQKFPFHNVIGSICCMKKLIFVKNDKKIRDKLIHITYITLFILLVQAFGKLVDRKRRKYAIRQTRKNIITFKMHLNKMYMFLGMLFSDQCVNLLLEIFYHRLGTVTVFEVWWVWQGFKFTQWTLWFPFMNSR